MSDIFSVLSVLAFFLSIAAVFFSARSATQVRELRDQLTPFDQSRMRLLETSLRETQDALEVVANRVKMMKVRGAANHVREDRPSETPDPYKNPDAWRLWMNNQMARGKVGPQN
jgi:hypothetical protein